MRIMINVTIVQAEHSTFHSQSQKHPLLVTPHGDNIVNLENHLHDLCR
jgi:uncharacterized Rossmann fold enzyme